ncbi:MAG: DUF502 domain-containing protein [Chitinophagales bacterium]
MKRIKHFLITTLIGGLTVILPIGIFLFLVGFLFNLFRSIIDPLTKIPIFQQLSNELLVDVVVMSAVLLLCFLLGLVVRTRIGRHLLKWIESVTISRLPLYRPIRETVLQFLGRKEIPFSKVVLINVFDTKTRMIGFVADEHEDGDYTIFVPTGPNPTNGFIFHVHPEQVQHTDIKPEDAMKTILGVGIGAKTYF